MTDAGRIDSIVIVGAGLAGGNAAVTLRGEGFRGRILLVGSENDAPYGRPPLSKTYLRGEEDLSGWLVKPLEWYGDNNVELLTGTTVERVDTGARRVTLGSGETVGYDRFLLCTGARPRRPRIPGIDLPGVHVLRTVGDCEAIKESVRPEARAVVVGMGFIGAEVAASLSQLGLVVTGVLSGASPLQSVLGKEVGAVFADLHRDHGVTLVSEDTVVGFEGSGALESVTTKGGLRIECDLAIVGAGIEPSVDLMVASPVGLDNGVLVDAALRTNVAEIYAAGDVANHAHPLFGRVRVEHYNSAEKMGRAVARSILGGGEPFGYVHTFWSDQFEDKLEYVGHAAHWDTFTIRGDLEEGHFLGFYLEGGVMKAAVGFNRGGDPELEEDSELRACQQLIEARAAVPSELLSDDRVDLQSLTGG